MLCIRINMWTVAAFILVVTLPGGQGEINNLTAKAGEKVTLTTGLSGLQGDYLVVWYLDSGTHNETLIHCDKGEMELDPPKRFEGKLHMDTTTGALTIGPLSIKDSGVYHGNIVEGNHKRHSYTYTVTVLEPDLIPPSAGPPENITADQRNHVAAVVSSCVLFVLVCIVLLACAVRQKKLKEIVARLPA